MRVVPLIDGGRVAYGWMVEFRILGPIEVYSDDSLLHVGGVKQRSIRAFVDGTNLT